MGTENTQGIAPKIYKYFTEKEVIGLDSTLCKMLDLARDHAGIPFIITSGKRSIEHNKEVGGVADSSHISGLAVDIRAGDDTTRAKVLMGLIKAGFQRIGIYSSHIHADIDTSKKNPVVWITQ